MPFGSMIFRHARPLALVAALGISALSLGGPAQAEGLSDLIERAREAFKTYSVQAAGDAPASTSSSGVEGQEGVKAVNIGVIGMQATKDGITAPAVTIGSNGYRASACVSFFSGSTPVTGLLTTSGTFIMATTAFFATTLNAACVVRGAVAINVTSISGSSFSYDAVAF